jgi:ABC-type oligopeptide transport system ATPase subunit
MTPILELRNVSKIFGGGMFDKNSTVAVEDVTFTIPSDSPTMIALAGESGSGKTTLSRLLLGVTKPSEGEVLYNGADLGTLSASTIPSTKPNICST